MCQNHRSSKKFEDIIITEDDITINIPYDKSDELEEIIELDAESNNKNKQKIAENCFICNNELKGGRFLCPVCGTFYCKTCIKSVVKHGGQCWSCKKKID